MTEVAFDRARGERLLATANRLTLARFALAGVLAVVAAADPASIGWPEAALMVVLWGTDLLDGRIARRGWRSGALPRADGRALDPVVDDAAYVVGFAVLLAAGVVPLWLLLLVALMRSVLTLTRMTGMAQGRPFARPRITGKAMGVVLAVGQCALALGAVAQLGSFERSLLLAVMMGACVAALVDFAYANRHVYADVMRPRQPPVMQRLAEPARAAPMYLRRTSGSGEQWEPSPADALPHEMADDSVAAYPVAVQI